MNGIIVGIVAVSGIVVLVLSFWSSVSRTKSSVRWLKGYNLKCAMQQDAVVELLRRVKYPEKKEVSVDGEGHISFITNRYSYPIEISQDEMGNTVIGIVINGSKLSKRNRKKVAYDWDNVYQFIKQEVEGIDAMTGYEKNRKIQKLYNIASVALVVGIILFVLFCM